MNKSDKEMVEYILRNIPDTRNSDITLMIEVWKRFYFQRMLTTPRGEAVLLRDLYDLPKQDTIKRIRADFNSEGKYYPTEWEVAKRRGIKEDLWRVSLGYPTKENTVKPTKTDSYMDEQREFKKPQLFN